MLFRSATPGAEAKIVVGSKELALAKEYPAGVDANKKEYDALTSKIVASSVEAGYPKAGDARIIKAQSFGAIFSNASALKLIALLSILVLYVTMVYGPIAALLVELFPTRIRYSGLSLPYHIGNGWFGGLMPATAFAMVAQTGDVFYGLWYPIAIALMTVVIGTLFVPETYMRNLFDDKSAQK